VLNNFVIEGEGDMLKIKIDKESNTPLYLQLYRKLKEKIVDELSADTKLPPIRKLSDMLGINPATVVKAYDMLAQDNLIYKKVGSGSFVAPAAVSAGFKEDKNDSMLNHGQIKLDKSINFASATPSTDLFPVDDFKYAINHVLDRDQGEAFTYQKSQGFLPLRKYIQDYLKSKSIYNNLKEIQIVSGAQQAIDIIAKILLDYGDKVVVEKATYFGALQAFASRKAEIKSIEIKRDGLDLDELEDYLKKNKIKLFFTMQNFQNPTGVNWSREKQQHLLELAEKYNFFIVEDDLLSDLYYTENAPSILKQLDKNERVIYIKSFSKVFMPGLRLALIVLPQKLLPEMLETKYATDISSAGLTQRAFDYYLREGFFEKHISLKRNLFKKRFEVMSEEIDKKLPEEIESFIKPEGGLYFWLKLPQGKDSSKLYEQAAEKGVVFSPGYLFTASSAKSEYFRLSFAAVDEKEIKKGMDILSEVVRDYLGSSDEDDFSPLL